MGLMEQIEQFSPGDWLASLTSCGEGLLLVATAYQSAVMIYCISSLHSASALVDDSAATLQRKKAEHHERLMLLLEEGLTSPQSRDSLMKCILWPLVVAGTELLNGSQVQMNFVKRQLQDMCQDIGSSLPLLAKAVLQRFWDSGLPGWDNCFEKPYAFVT